MPNRAPPPAPPAVVPDSERHGWLRWLPAPARPYALLARFDRPIGAWLLFWPCVWGVLLAGGGLGAATRLIAWLALGSVAMRGAGCVWNDIVDRDLDAQVARTRGRPIASGRVTRRTAAVWLALLCLVGLVVLAALDGRARIVALASIVPVACYPFMKRITWWPQAWLGLVFSWGALVGWVAVTHGFAGPLAWLYAGSILWVVGYDTIYALQDIEDDALVGVKSSARAMGRHVRGGVVACYAGALACWAMALALRAPGGMAAAALLPAALHLGWQVATLDPGSPAGALARFRSNRTAGGLVALATLLVGGAGAGL